MSDTAAVTDVRTLLVGVTATVSIGGGTTSRLRWNLATWSDDVVAAVGRTCLEACGTTIDGARLRTTLAVEEQCAKDAAERFINELPWVAASIERRVHWPRLSVVLGLGYHQGIVLHKVARAPATTRDAVAMLAAVLNATIVLFDRIVDEHPVRAGLAFEVVTPALVRAAFDPQGRHTKFDAARKHCGDDDELVAVVDLIEGWSVLVQRQNADGRRPSQWRRLARRTARLLSAQRRATIGIDSKRHQAALRKSVEPSLVVADLIAASSRLDAAATDALASAALRIGRVFALADDMADLADDARHGRPNILLCHLPRSGLDVAEVVDCLARGAQELSTELAASAGSPEADAFAESIAAAWLRWDGHPVSRRPPDRSAPQGAVRFLLAQRQAGYPELAHHLTLPRGQPGNLEMETHDGSIFGRATVLESLIDAHLHGLPVADSALAADILWLLRARHPAGAWNYLPSVPELPPDLDDLAQVYRVLGRWGGAALAGIADADVRQVLDSAAPDGGLATWIIPAGHPLRDQMLNYVDVVGGRGAHVDVMANAIDALLVVDPHRYRGSVRASVEYVARAQQPDGSWTSRWYAGPFYGTALAVGVLAGDTRWDPTCQRALSFLDGTVNDDHGWGSGTEEALATAFAVRALHQLVEPGDPRIVRAVRRLTALQEPDGGWPAGSWIGFETQDGHVTAGGRTIATAFALRALLWTGQRA